MRYKHFQITLSFLLFALFCTSQNHQSRLESIDVQHYKFEIHLNDTTDQIEGITTVFVKFLKPVEYIIFDLINTDSLNMGMSVVSVTKENDTLHFNHLNNLLNIQLSEETSANEILELQIRYAGFPKDGIIISKNKYGERTFFGDNWPDRAKHWLPTVDHPSDKATVEFKVYAPEHYEVVSNGHLVEKKVLDNNIEFTYWKEDIPISTKLMVIGAADFAVGNKTSYKNIPVSSWVFEQNKEKGFENYKYGTKALEYFSELIGPYSYEKLVHVQSKTRYGGMENASCIFYSERTATSHNSQENLFAHEVAHQWFGNSVTEQNWHHLWLSEGFATYLTHVYKQHFYGEEIFREGLISDRKRVIRYSKQNLAPIIDTTVNEYIRLLNTNSYQKASWFLHMLRMDLGDEVFFKGLQKYYTDFQNSTALTIDFKNVMETVSEKDLDMFFKQWLWQAGHPVLNVAWGFKGDSCTISVQQSAPTSLFRFPLEIEILFDDGSSEHKTLEIIESVKVQKFPLQNNSKVNRILFDPNVKLLFEYAGKNY